MYNRIFLIALDCFALIAAFTASYILRITLDSRPLFIQVDALEFITSIVAMLPLWIILFYFFGLYRSSVYTHPVREFGKLGIAAIFGVMIMISFSFFTDTMLFPTKLVAAYAVITSFLILLILRVGANIFRMWLLTKKVGTKNVILVGNSPLTSSLARYIISHPSTGFQLIGIVARSQF